MAYLRDHGYTRLAVMESCTGGNFTLLVFKITGYADICRRYGAKPVYLDEGPTVEVDLCDGTHIRVSRCLHDDVIQRGDNPSTIPQLVEESSISGDSALRQALRPAQGGAQDAASTSACPN